MFRPLVLFAFVFLVTVSTFSQTPIIETGVPQTLAKWRGANYSDVRYKLNLTLEKMSTVLKGTIEISLKNNADQIVLDWRRIRGKEDLSKVSNVSVNGKAATFEEINEHLVFKENVVKGENIIKLDFTSPIATSGAAITRYVDNEDGAEYVYSLFVPSDASTAFPVFDQPDLKARFSLSATFPADWKFVTNTEASIEYKVTVSDCSENCELIKLDFYATNPISTYVFAFAAGSFEVFRECLYINKAVGKDTLNCLEIPKTYQENKTTSKIYVRKSQAEKFKPHAAETFRLNREAVKYLESYFDYKFPFPKYDLVLIPEFPFGGMEHVGATFLRESSVIFPSEPTANDYISRANLIFHEAAHQWFGDTVTMKWFDDLWLKEGFAEFMAYKTLAKVLPEYNAWKAFYERNKPLAYLTDSTRGTTPIYQEIPNLSAAKSAYGNIVYRKAPSFLRQAEFYLGEDKFQIAVRSFLKKHEFANAEWTDLVKEFEMAGGFRQGDLKEWTNVWVKQRGLSKITVRSGVLPSSIGQDGTNYSLQQSNDFNFPDYWRQKVKILVIAPNDKRTIHDFLFGGANVGDALNGIHAKTFLSVNPHKPIYSTVDDYESKTNLPYFQPSPKLDSLLGKEKPKFIFPNYQDYGYGIFLLDEKSRDYVLGNIQNEPDDFLRSMMWGTLWDSVRETELAPRDYVTLAIKNIGAERDELTINTILGRVSTAMNYYLPDAQSKELAAQLETLLTQKMQNAPTLGQRITFYRAFLNVATTDKAKQTLKDVLSGKLQIKDLKLKTKDRFDIATKLLILSDKDAPNLLAELEKTETSDDAKRYAYAAKAGVSTAENKQKYFADFIGNKEISESYIETAFAPFNSTRHAELTLPFLENALKELPNLKRSRKIFFVNGWLAAFIGGQKGEQALAIVNKFLTDNPNLDKDLRLKILEVANGLERSVKIKKKFTK